MLQKVSYFLQALFRGEQSTRFSSTDQAAQQVMQARDTGKQDLSSVLKREPIERDTLPVMPALVRERTTEHIHRWCKRRIRHCVIETLMRCWKNSNANACTIWIRSLSRM